MRMCMPLILLEVHDSAETISIVNLFFVHRSACLSKVFGVFDKKKEKNV